LFKLEKHLGMQKGYIYLTPHYNGGYDLHYLRYPGDPEPPPIIDLTPFIREFELPEQDWRPDSSIPEDFFNV
jgi:hypothetical protein